MHPDKEAAAVVITSGPSLDEGVYLLPASEIEVAYAEVSAFGNF
jgi:hypothetical protein